MPFKFPDDARAALGMDSATFALGLTNVSTTSRFFEVRSRLRLDKLVVEEHAIVERDGIDVKVLQRWRAPPAPDAYGAADTTGGAAADGGMR